MSQNVPTAVITRESTRLWSNQEWALDDLPGVGPARKRLLLSHFGTPERFLEATREELEAVPGVPGKVARDVYEYVNKIR